MLLPPVLIALIWMVSAWAVGQGQAAAQGQPRLRPSSRIGTLAVGAMPLTLVVLVAPSPLPVAIPIGVVLVVPALLARLRSRDRGLLVIAPLVFGAWYVAFPTFYLLLGGLGGD